METYAILDRGARWLDARRTIPIRRRRQDASREEASVGDKGPGSKSKDTKKKTGKKK